MRLNLLYPHAESIGYGRYGVKLAEALQAAGVDVYDSLPGPLEGMAHLQGTAAAGSLKPGPLAELYNDRRDVPICETVAWVSVPSHARGWWKGQRAVMSTMWEARKLPESFRENLHEFDTIIVPSQQNLELFSEYHDNVKLVFLGVDPVEWHYVERTPPAAFFNFMIGGSGDRKGTDLAYEAFQKVFPDGSWGDGPIPQLIMKNPKGEEKFAYRDRVQLVSGRLSPADEVALYETAHCYLQPSRGEGFGLQPLQAIAQGIPTVLTGGHGHAAFSHLGYPIDATPAQSSYFIYGDAGEWWEPNFDQLCERMLYVYNNYDEACLKARGAAAVVARKFTWAHTAAVFIDALGRDRLGPLVGEREWYIPTAKMYKTVLLRDHHCEIGGVQRIFHRGEETWEPADVKRILFEANLLDPVCVLNHGDPEDTGLLPDQLVRFAKYEARNAYCPTCSQQLNTHPTRTDDALLAADRALRLVR